MRAEIAKPKETLSLQNKQRRQKGFTLIELMVVLVISSVVMAAIYNIFLSQQRAYVGQEFTSETQQNFRAAVNLMAREIRLAGHSDDYITLPTDNNCLVEPGICDTSDATHLAFTYIDTDCLTDGQDNDNDGHQDGADPDEKRVWVKYDLYDAFGNGITDLGRTIGVGSNLGTGIHSPAVMNIQQIEFRYLIDNTTGGFTYAPAVTSANMRQVRGVEITILARSEASEPGQNFQTIFTTPGGTVWSLAAGVRGRLFTTTVMCRNLNI